MSDELIIRKVFATIYFGHDVPHLQGQEASGWGQRVGRVPGGRHLMSGVQVHLGGNLSSGIHRKMSAELLMTSAFPRHVSLRRHWLRERSGSD